MHFTPPAWLYQPAVLAALSPGDAEAAIQLGAVQVRWHDCDSFSGTSLFKTAKLMLIAKVRGAEPA
jgi:hypothetical protein